MTVGVQTFDGDRLAEARRARGMFKKTLGDLIGVSGTAITRYEAGEDKPQRERLSAIAQHLGFPESFFLRCAWSENFEPVFWRSRAAESKLAREMTEQRMKWMCEIFHFLEQEVNFPHVNLPDVSVPDDFKLIAPDIIERISDQVRDAWKLGRRPIPDVLLALENAGVPVVNLEITSEKQDGFCFRSTILARPFVGINVYQISCARARYDAAHELGHLILHRNVTSRQERDPASKKLIEQQAHRFAGAFLFPQKAFLSEVGFPSLDYFCDLKKRWGMSIAAMVYRACDLGLIDVVERAMLFQSMGRRHWRGPLREPFDSSSEMPLEKPRMFRRGLETVLKESIFGPEAVRGALSLPPRELEQIIGVEAGVLAPSNVAELPVTPRRESLRAVDLESGNVLEFPGQQRRLI